MSLTLTGGRFKGSRLKTPSGMNLTRPTSGKVRQALFNVLRGRFEDSSFLDLYAGSGAVGLEALSRGAANVLLIENHPAAFRALDANCKLLLARGADDQALEWKREDARAFCARESSSPTGRRFDIVFADPPFGLDFTGLRADVLPLLKEGGLAVVQFPSRNPPGWTEAAARVLTYGESSLALLEGTGSGAGF